MRIILIRRRWNAAYPHPIWARKRYPDNPWSQPIGQLVLGRERATRITSEVRHAAAGAIATAVADTIADAISAAIATTFAATQNRARQLGRGRGLVTTASVRGRG